jgi:sodium/bile acid cotransporter 7
MRELIRKQWFVIALVGAVLLAFKIPEWGATGGTLRSEITSEIGIILIFFFQGWMLPTEVLAKSMFHWKAHLFTQVFIFLLFPGIILLGDLGWSSAMPDSLRIGFYFLAVVPTTITSAIIYTSQAGGNTAVSLVNTTVANLAGVLITPIWMTLLVGSGGGEMGELGTVFLKLTKLILLPFFVGQIAHVFWKSAVLIIKVPAGYMNQGIIVFIVFSAFSNSVTGGVWEGQGGPLVFLTFVLCLLIFVVVVVICLWGITVLKFEKEDQSAIFFCSTQKTLAAAIPLAISLFGDDPTIGIMLLPVMIYHPIQLILGALLINRFRRQSLV